jgi:Bacterial regulatory protein, arsR family
MSVGQIVAAVDVGQSTVSAHLKTLAEVRFVLAHHRGTATCYRINQACVRCFPTAADLVMGKPASAAQAGVTNARFLLGRVEQIPLPGGHVDVIISNCVINLAADKARVPAEA